MNIEYTTIPLEEALTHRAQAEFQRILDLLPIVRNTIKAGGWICGGFARQLLLDLPINQYFRPSKEPGATFCSQGDIDIFFNSPEIARSMTPEFAHPSVAGFAKEIYDHVKIQFVDNPRFIRPTIEETLSNFDIINCRVAINDRFVIMPQGWRELEESKLIRIGKSDNPFLGGRIMKYIEHRGFKGITEDSYEALTNWLAYAGNDFREGGWQPQHLLSIRFNVKRLREKGFVRKEDLIFFINKWKEVVRMEDVDSDLPYGPSLHYEVDWALNELTSDREVDI